MPESTLTTPDMSVIFIIAFWCPVIMSVIPAEPAHTATSRPAESTARIDAPATYSPWVPKKCSTQWPRNTKISKAPNAGRPARVAPARRARSSCRIFPCAWSSAMMGGITPEKMAKGVATNTTSRADETP